MTVPKSSSSEYQSYANAKDRCTRQKNKRYKYYGGRGIEFRFVSFAEFFEEIGFKPSPEHTLDRIDIDGHYEKGNVRWATVKEQNNNQSRNTFIEHDGKRLTIAQWSEITGVNFQTIGERLRRGYCSSCAVSPNKGRRCKHR